MPLVCYLPVNFRPHVRKQIAQANDILDELRAKGYTLTLRQLFYQFVARGLLPNTQKNYKRLGDTVSKARRAGLIDWNAIEDITRFLRGPKFWSDESDIVEACAGSFNLDTWADQRHRPEVWVEKDAMIGVVAVACRPYEVPHLSCRGYVSDSECWGAAQRLKRYAAGGQTPVVFHLGDHDPSGCDMSRDILTRVALFAGQGIRFERLALNMDQVRHYNPPPNPAKQTDSRFAAYEAEHGDESWELDALDPDVIGQLVKAAVTPLIDRKKWRAAEVRVAGARRTLAEAAKRWPEVAEFLRKPKPKKPKPKKKPGGRARRANP